jgi:hypothetical protein
MINSDPLNTNIYLEYKNNGSLLGYESEIRGRLNYILSFIFLHFGGGELNITSWSFDINYDDCENFDSLLCDDEIQGIITPFSKTAKFENILLNDGKKWKFSYSVPIRWLFEGFEKEIVEGREKYLKQSKHNKEKKKLKEINRQEIKESIKSKLTKEELHFLGIK